jgi:hypothetical protein
VGSWRISIVWAVAFGLALFGIKLWLIGSYANATPFWDQWDAEAAFLYQPYLEGKLGWADLLAPHNEHRIFTMRLLALALLEANGSWNPILQMVVNAALHVFALMLGILLLVPAIGSSRLPIVLAFALFLFGVPYAWENTLSGFQAQFYLLLLFSVVCLWLAVLAEPLSFRWWGGVVFAVLAYLSLASGVFALAAAAGVGMILFALGVRRSRGQVIAIVILLALFAVGVALTPVNPGHESLKAASLLQFVEATRAVLSWPFPPSFRAAILRNAPIMVFGVWLLWKRPPAGDVRWFLAALALWVLTQAASIAYGRAVGSTASRYTDLFANAILVNFICLVVLGREFRASWRAVVILLPCAWVALTFNALVFHAGKSVPAELETKRATGLAQETNVRNFVLTGDIAHLANKPHLQVPYPSAERLAAILSLPQLRSILPANIRAPLEPVKVDIEPREGFIPKGYFPTTPARSGFILGSYGLQGDAGVGEARMQFAGTKRGGELAIPVSGYPGREGIGLAVEQRGKAIDVRLPQEPKESWSMAYASVEGGPFSIVIADRSATTWVAIGAPAPVEGLVGIINRLLESYAAFLAAAFALALGLTWMPRDSGSGPDASGAH